MQVVRALRRVLPSSAHGRPLPNPLIDPHALPCCDARSTDYVQIITDQAGELIFFSVPIGPFIPTLKFLHKYPDILPKYQVDWGAISFVLSGANIMAPGLTSPGGKMDDVPAEAVVAIMAEGKENALAIGITTMSTKQILSDNKGIAVENTHWLRDGLLLGHASDYPVASISSSSSGGDVEHPRAAHVEPSGAGTGSLELGQPCGWWCGPTTSLGTRAPWSLRVTKYVPLARYSFGASLRAFRRRVCAAPARVARRCRKSLVV